MLTIYLMLAVFTIANGVWTIINWREMQMRKKVLGAAVLSAEQMQSQARELLRRAQNVSVGQDYKVCSECKRITARHQTDDSGKITCVNCLGKLVKVNG
jgi:hypothetical protein